MVLRRDIVKRTGVKVIVRVNAFSLINSLLEISGLEVQTDHVLIIIAKNSLDQLHSYEYVDAITYLGFLNSWTVQTVSSPVGKSAIRFLFQSRITT